eukprot:COSAG02_NODE_1436_length_12609_cov_1282.385292_4_plen_137_part_00
MKTRTRAAFRRQRAAYARCDRLVAQKMWGRSWQAKVPPEVRREAMEQAGFEGQTALKECLRAMQRAARLYCTVQRWVGKHKPSVAWQRFVAQQQWRRDPYGFIKRLVKLTPPARVYARAHRACAPRAVDLSFKWYR